MYDIRMPVESDRESYRPHVLRHSLESGKDGSLIFIPFDGPSNLSESRLDSQFESWRRPLNEVGWGRCWLLFKGSDVVGSVEFAQRPPMKSALHRVTLMMGLEAEARGYGWGTKLVETALGWAYAQPSIEHIDLRVLSHNQPALNLYKKFGFKEMGRINDCFRVQGQKIDDILMTLALRYETAKD